MKTTLPTSKWSSALTLVAALCAIAPTALAEHPIPESERWATITHPGNAPYTVVDPTGYPNRYVGAVDHEYQISRTEVTGTEWFEFVQAYAPYVDESDWADIGFTSTSIGLTGYRQYSMSAANANRPVEIGWHFAARYVNWLHNGRALTPGAFESGAYDSSTFGEHPGGGWTDQITHSPGATYWIPSVDERTKATFFDPDRHGEGMPGYWLYPNSSDTMPAFGSPTNGGETSTGGRFTFPLPDVAAYRNVRSPWGLWDCSGGRSEWTEDVVYSQFATGYTGRLTQGSDWRDSYSDAFFFFDFDGLADLRDLNPLSFNGVGLRVARAVPGPSGAGVLCVCAPVFLAPRKRRRIHDSLQPDRDRRVAHSNE